MARHDETRIPAAVLAAALAAVLGAIGMYIALRRRKDARWLDGLIRRSGSDERRRGCHDSQCGTEPIPDGSGCADMVENQAIEPVQPASGVRLSVIR